MPASPASRAFFDTNILLYLISSDPGKADIAEALLAQGGVISVQVLNEFLNVSIRKSKLSFDDACTVLDGCRSFLDVSPITAEHHDQAREIMRRYGYAVYDSQIIASALSENCAILYSEDLQDGQRIFDKVTILNPFSLLPSA